MSELQYPNLKKWTKKQHPLLLPLSSPPHIPAGSAPSLADLCTSVQRVGRQDTVGSLVSGRTGGDTGRGAGAGGREGMGRGSRIRVVNQWRTFVEKMKLIE